MRVSSMYKAQKGLIKISADVDNGTIRSIQITGDFFMYPEDALPRLEAKLSGKKLELQDISKAVDDFYGNGVQTPSMTKEDMVNAIMGVRDAGQTS